MAETIQRQQPMDMQFPCCKIAWWWHELENPGDDSSSQEAVKVSLFEKIKEDLMACIYKKAVAKFSWPLDRVLLQEMESEQKRILDSLEAKVADANENFGAEEVRDALLEKANFFCRIGDVKNAVSAYETTYSKTVGVGGKLDITHAVISLGFTFSDRKLVKDNIVKAKEDMEKGGDWERRNRLKVCEALQCILERKLDTASNLLLSLLPSFTHSSLITFETYIFYTGILALVCCDRDVIKEKVVSAPPVLESGDKNLKVLLSSFCRGNYVDFMATLVPIAKRIKRDLYLSQHYCHLIRYLRLRGYKQFLEPYKSVSIHKMADAFGVSNTFMEDELSKFVASGKLACRIDRVRGVMERDQMDPRSVIYSDLLKQGDALMNRIQKLERIVAL